MRNVHRAIFVLLLFGMLTVARAAGPQQDVKPQGHPLRAGVNGTGSPQCIYCPQPEYSDEARVAKCSGNVLLDVTVTADGKVTDAVVLRSPGMGLDKQALSQMNKWEMKPALGPNGKPVDCRVQIEVTFKIYQDASFNDAKGIAGVCIDKARADALQLGYHGVLLGQEVYEPGGKAPNPALSASGCAIEKSGAGPTLDEQFFTLAASTACVVNTVKDGRVRRIVVDSRGSLSSTIEMLTQKYGQPLTGLYRVADNGPVDATLWSWKFPAESGKQMTKATISVEPKTQPRRSGSGFASYVEIVFQQ